MHRKSLEAAQHLQKTEPEKREEPENIADQDGSTSSSDSTDTEKEHEQTSLNSSKSKSPPSDISTERSQIISTNECQETKAQTSKEDERTEDLLNDTEIKDSKKSSNEDVKSKISRENEPKCHEFKNVKEKKSKLKSLHQRNKRGIKDKRCDKEDEMEETSEEDISDIESEFGRPPNIFANLVHDFR